jgi:general secretion pathway protein D
MRLVLLLLASALSAQTIQEKREGAVTSEWSYEGIAEVNAELAGAYEELRALYAQAAALEERDPFLPLLLEEVQRLKEEINWIQQAWREQTADHSESYALWHQPHTTVEQLVLEYGSSDHLYLIPPDVAEVQVSIASDLPVPREAWDELLLSLLANCGVGVEARGPYLRKLYSTSEQPFTVSQIISRREALTLLPPETRVCYVLFPGCADIQPLTDALQRVSYTSDAWVRPIGRQLFLFGTADELRQMLKLYDFVQEGVGQREHQLVTLTKISGAEMQEILETYFRDQLEEQTLRLQRLESLPSSLFITGHPDEMQLALRVIEDVEGEICNPKALTTYTYATRHTDAEELADVLYRAYCLMVQSPCEIASTAVPEAPIDPDRPIDPTPVTTEPRGRPLQVAEEQGNFVVDPKTGTIVMVIEEAFLPEIQSLLRRLDVPKKMVRLEVLLFEKRIDSTNKFGLDLLRIGAPANNVNDTGVSFNQSSGLTQFLLSGVKTASSPKFDILYDFLLTQEDIRINSNPSITTVNHTPARIELVEEISIDNGTFIDPDFKDNILKRSFTRTQYGITIEITPDINDFWVNERGEVEHFITLQTDVLFDTPMESNNDRPPVIRRHISNEVRIGNGETVILGGLRSKRTEDDSHHLPFIGELPGIGKFFSSTTMRDRDTEMFIFITPHIIEDPIEELERMKRDEMCRRPGDLPEFLECLLEAEECEKKRLFGGSLKALFGRPERECCWHG